jgi:hypothetical protein
MHHVDTCLSYNYNQSTIILLAKRRKRRGKNAYKMSNIAGFWFNNYCRGMKYKIKM